MPMANIAPGRRGLPSGSAPFRGSVTGRRPLRRPVGGDSPAGWVLRVLFGTSDFAGAFPLFYPAEMKRLCGSVLLLMWCAYAALGVGPNEEYVRVYSLIQQGEGLEDSKKSTEALAVYMDAERVLKQLKRSNPQWNPKVVDFRLRYLQAKIATLTPAEPVAVTPAQTETSSGTTAEGAAAIEALNAEVRRLQQDLGRLETDNSTMQAKLREALSVRPAASDPRELEQSLERNRALTKDIELLQTQLADARSLAESDPDTEALKEAQRALKEQTRRADQLESDRASLASRVGALTLSAEAVDALRQENEVLKQQLTDLQTAPPTAVQDSAEVRLNEVLTELALLRSEADILRLEKTALEDRMTRQQGRPATVAAVAASELAESRARAADLEREREELQIQLAQADQELADRGLVVVGEPNGLAQAEIDQLKARLAVYEADTIPYATEELVLMRMSRGLEASNASTPAPPSEVGPLIVQAESQFKRGEFPQAEVTLKKMLEADDSNAFTLSNLAATQMEQGRDAEAEVHLKKALAIAPRDPFTLATMGILKFRQQEYEDALDYLGLAAQYNPDSPVIHNYLGMALSEQGMRGPAETALRRAIQLQPGFADAHFNLALVYILQEPPLRELARWHYQKCLTAGHPRSTEMEQLLDKRGSE